MYNADRALDITDDIVYCIKVSIIDFALFIVTVCAVLLAVLVWTRRKHHLINISFSVFTLSVGLWSFTIAMFRMARTVDVALSSLQMVYVMSTLLVCTFVYFAEEFPFVRKPFYASFRYAIPIPFFVSLLLIFIGTLFIQDVSVAEAGNVATLGPAYVVWIIWAVVYMGWGMVELVRKYRLASSLHRLQLRYMLVAVALPLTVSLPMFGILPALDTFTFIWLGPVAALGMIALVSYAISRHRLMDIRLFLRRTITFVLATTLLISVASGMIFALNTYFGLFEIDDTALVTAIVVFSVALAGFNPILNIIQRFINRFMFRTYYSHEESLRSLSKEITKIIDYDELISAIVNRIMKTIGLHKASIVLLDSRVDNRLQSVTIIGFTDALNHVLAKDDFVATWLRQRKQALLFEEMEYQARISKNDDERRQLHYLQRAMLRHKIGVILPMFYQEKLYGIMVLGNKLSGDVYTTDDLELLDTVTDQATIALEHAKMYKDIQKIVEEQTSEIRKNNEDLQELLQIKSDFLTIASHQLRTPMTAIRGFLSFLVEEDMPAEQKIQFAEQAYESANRMELVINDILTASELEGHDVAMDLEPADIQKICEEAISATKPLIVKKQLDIKFVHKKTQPHVLTDARRVKECLDNLLANAVYYTPEGSITVKVDSFRQYVRISVKDTGVGFTKKEAKEFGDKFYRAERVRKQVADGSGLGLFITNTYMKALGGKLVFKSKGRNKGSEFALLIPKQYKK